MLAVLAPGHPISAVLITPKADGLLTLGSGVLQRYALDNPHPETSWKTLFGKVWHEGYSKPERRLAIHRGHRRCGDEVQSGAAHLWHHQGHCLRDAVRVPLAVFAALYTSQFMDPVFRSKVKPTVEIMAALPSVVIGFLAGLYLASVVEKNLVAALVMLPLLPVIGTAGIFLWRLLPRRVVGGLRAGSELALIVPLLLGAIWLSLAIGPTVENWLFNGDARLWLSGTLGVTYDQRNCLVVGIAMDLP